MMGAHAAPRALALVFTALVLTTLVLPAAAAPPRFAAVLKAGQGARPPHCAVTGWATATLPCPNNTVCRVSSVAFNASVSNCVAVRDELPVCSLAVCAQSGGDALCKDYRGAARGLRYRCRELGNEICDVPVACDPVLGEFRPMEVSRPKYIISRGRPLAWVLAPPGPRVCDSTGVKWANKCALLRGLCRQQFLGALGPTPGKC